MRMIRLHGIFPIVFVQKSLITTIQNRFSQLFFGEEAEIYIICMLCVLLFLLSLLLLSLHPRGYIFFPSLKLLVNRRWTQRVSKECIYLAIQLNRMEFSTDRSEMRNI